MGIHRWAGEGGGEVPTGHTIQQFPEVEAAILMGQTMAGQSLSSGRGHGGQALGRLLWPPSESLRGPNSSPESVMGNTDGKEPGSQG